ncbi:MAG: hypothetical protein BWY83_03377 [bacterium ADurb.Bin478]|nr:MAG: hypothetical protein BWY83_03377 [bacterium ADurb.Bin478]
MQTADAVDAAGHVDGKDGHVELAAGLRTVDSAQVMDLLTAELQGVEIAAKIPVDQPGIEFIDAGRHRRVAGEQIARTRGLLRFGKVHPSFLHQGARTLQRHKGGVSFVHMADTGTDAQLFQGTQSADAEHDLLFDAHVVVAAVQLVRDILIGNAVLRQIGV